MIHLQKKNVNKTTHLIVYVFDELLYTYIYNRQDFSYKANKISILSHFQFYPLNGD